MGETAFVGWCPQCGPVTAVDEDGLCRTCGATAQGDGAEAAVKAEPERDRLRGQVAAMQEEIKELREANEQAAAVIKAVVDMRDIRLQGGLSWPPILGKPVLAFIDAAFACCKAVDDMQTA